MCGFFGILQHRSQTVPARELLQETAARLQHRGPDGSGIHREPGLGLVHRRLSLVDLNARSDQPFWDASRRYCLLYNGELYDHADLRAPLERLGVRFRTTSDTEVLLEALIHWGVERTLPRLEGMFAFAFLDAETRELVCARDRFGIKPLFIHDGDDAFLCSSTVHAMTPWLALRPDARMMSSYLHGFNGPTTGRSFYDRVTIVPPGAVVRVAPGAHATITPCLSLEQLIDRDLGESLAHRPRGELVDRVEQALLHSVKSQLQADVPVGAFCSGGVDSSLLMAMAARVHGDLRVFHADVVGPLSERTAAERLAKHLGLEMQAVPVTDRAFVDSIPDVVEHFGFPFAAQPTTVPLLHVSALVRDHGIKAVLTGEGSDECFLGYPWLVPNVRGALRRLPQRLLGKLGVGAPTRDATSPDRALVTSVLTQLEPTVEVDWRAEASATGPHPASVSQGLATDPELSYILRTLLHRNDTMGMASSIEARFPFLDSRLVRLSVNLPYASKVRFSPTVFDDDHLFYRDKWVVRRVADRYLPPILAQRRKGAFPTSAFQRIEVDHAYFDRSVLADWLALSPSRLAHLLAQASPALTLRLLHLDAWQHRCIHDLPRASLETRLARYVRVRPH